MGEIEEARKIAQKICTSSCQEHLLQIMPSNGLKYGKESGKGA